MFENKKIALIDTIPVTARNQGSINLGFDIARNTLKADVYHWRQQLKGTYDIIAFNVFYITHIFNIAPFLFNNGIEPLKDRRNTPEIFVGGQGVSNLNGCLDDIVDFIFKGEVDGIQNDLGWFRADKIDSPFNIKNGKAVIELTRGCKYRCSFCEYGWVHGGIYREKDIGLVETQLKSIKDAGVKRVNFLSANLGAYSELKYLLNLCDKYGIHILNTDVCLRDLSKIEMLIKSNHPVKIGVESFSEQTRKRMNKPFSDEKLDYVYKNLAEYTSLIHSYLIYGLPGENYDSWFVWLEKISKTRKEQTSHNIRFDFNLTNFEPCKGTPLETEPKVNFSEKDEFLKQWALALQKHGFHKGKGEITYKNSKGRFGRKEKSYLLLMKLREAGPEITEAIINSFTHGIGRSIKDADADKFLRRCNGEFVRSNKVKQGGLSVPEFIADKEII